MSRLQLLKEIGPLSKKFLVNALASLAKRFSFSVFPFISGVSTPNTRTGTFSQYIAKEQFKLILKVSPSYTEAMDTLLECSRLQNQYVDTTAESFEKIHGSTQNIVGQVSNLRTTVDVVMEENKQVEEGIENVANVTQRVMDSANETLASCNTNLQSIAKVAEIMNVLTEEATKLQ